MTKSSKILIIIIIAAIGILTYIEASEPEPVNWYPSYAKTDKIPLGSFVSYNLIKESFDTQGLQDINQPPYEFLNDNDSISGTYFFINGSINFDKNELNTLLKWVENGNTLFVSAKTIENRLLDTLNIETDNLISIDNISTKPLIELVNKELKTQLPFLYDQDIYNPYFNELDTINATILGVTQLYNDTLKVKDPKVNYIQQSFGKGKILLHTFPEAFGNYFMLTDKNYQYTQNLLAYINPNQKILWDNYYKSGKTFYTSPLFLLLNNRYLKWAYYFVLIGVVLFVIFEGKRKQRSIPIIEPLKNQTLSFTKTISGMYFEKGKHKEIATKQNLLFLDYVRNVLRIPTNELNEKTIIDIAARSNNSIEDTKILFKYFDELNKKVKIEKEDLLKLYELISIFKSRS
ncbi:hypothetical protein IWQ47_000207 [Aquimarina sp. EL_43]|uniref:DUF4350 domain-containing protein n=1 Tax=unclassified Aquimarina TaxID=2627091 RepID=UPI0018CAD3F9|nr:MULTISPECIES: DUF4350 domain-containing protein [unclassified Aquimarina]MBG6129101.1 hypothetical protein [Aquimarina sp. EL_35]MBG6150166.1 hypothetical protein [Aquimarina sp. EL_32]MBG6167149.1 hypothetical protein [Aquimarina sp. EL_43]